VTALVKGVARPAAPGPCPCGDTRHTITAHISSELDELADYATSLQQEQRIDGWRAWLDTGRDLETLARELGLTATEASDAR
jgi:hypothetical protein